MKINRNILSVFALLPGLGLLVSSCHKDNSPNPSSPKSINFVSSVIQGTRQQGQLDSFQFDGKQRLNAWLHYYTDTVNPGTNDTARISFNYNGNDSLPFSYTYYDANTGNPQTESHVLKYDDQGRITRDTVDGSSKGYYISYGDNLIVVQKLTHYGWTSYQIDSFFLNKGNIVTYKNYIANSSGATLSNTTNFTYYSTANPLYQSLYGARTGAFIREFSAYYFGASLDAISENACQTIDRSANGGFLLRYVQVTDSKNRLQSLIPDNQVVFFPMTFNYY